MSVTSRYQVNPDEEYWIAVKNIFKYLRRIKDFMLVFGGGSKLKSVTFSADVPLYLTCIPYQCLHTHWLRGQPSYMANNDLCLINVVVLGNNGSFGCK